MFYENGYESVSVKRLDELHSNGCAQVSVPLKYMSLKTKLLMLGMPAELLKAIEYLNGHLNDCSGSSAEFALHFICEDLYDVKFVRQEEPELLTA